MPVSAQSSSCTSALIALLGDGCHYMYNDSAGAAVYCNGAMTLSAKTGDAAVTQGCSSSTSGGGSTSSSCSASLTALLGTGCHYMYNNSAGNAIYCDSAMTVSAKEGDTATTQGCSSSTTTGGSTSSSCSSALITLLGTGCHYMYNNSAGNAIYCDSAMTVSAKEGDTATTQGCSGSTVTSSTTSSSCSAALITLLGTGCHYMYNDTAGNATYCDGAMTISAKAGDAAITQGCSSYSGTSSGGTTSTTSSAPIISNVNIIDIHDTSVTITWNTDKSSTSKVEYWIGNAYGAFKEDAALITYHSITLDGLQPGTAYSFNAVSRDANYYTGYAYNRTFTTTGSPQTTTTATATTTTTTGSCPSAYHYMSPSAGGSTGYCMSDTDGSICQPLGGGSTYTCPAAGTTTTTATTTPTIGSLTCSSGYHYMYPYTSGSSGYCMSDTSGSVCQPLGGGATYSCPGTNTSTATTTTTTTAQSGCETALVALLGTGCHYMYNDSAGNRIYCNGDMTQSAKYGDTALTQGCSGSTSTAPSSSCSAALTALLGTGCHYMYNDSAGNRIYCNGDMTQSAKYGDTALTQGCSGSTSTTSSSSCSAALTALLGTGCHYMYNDSAGKPTYCNSAMTFSAKEGDTTTTQGCSYSGSTPYPSTTCDSALTALLGTGCHYMYNDSASNAIYCNGNMTQSAKKGDTAITQGCSYSGNITSPATNCDTALATLLGAGCHYMYSDTSGNPVYCDGAMTISAKKGDTVTTQGCSSGTGTGAFAVTWVNSATVSDGKLRVTIGFSRTVDQTTLTDSNIGLFRIADGLRVNAKISAYASGLEYLTFEPLAAGFSYELRMKKSVRDTAGNELPADYVSPSISVSGALPKAFGVDPSRTFPAQNASGVDTSSRIRVSFTKAINSDSLKTQFFSLVNMADSAKILSGTFSIFSDAFEFIPASALEPNAKYLYNVFAAIQDTTGVPLAAPFSASFSTAGGTAVQGGEVSGTVSDSAGNPVGRAFIYFSRSDFAFSRNVETDAAGKFFATLPAGTYRVEIFPPLGRGDLIKPDVAAVSVAAGTSQTLTFRFGAAIKTITGLVLFSSGNPVLDAEVGAYSGESGEWASGSVDGKGRYTLKVNSGTWQVGIRPKNPASVLWSYTGPFPKVLFSKDAIAETQVVDFTVPVSDGKLIVKTVDQAGGVVANAGVIVDTISSGRAGTEFRTSPQFKTSETSGSVSFSVRGGTYYVRGALPPESGFLNPEEQEISVYSGETRTVTLAFRKRDAATAVFLSGVTRLEDGTPTDAFMWAWSEKGGFANTRSDASGIFRVQVSPSERWHIGAGKEISGVPYKAPEIIVDVGASSANIELFLTKFSDVPLPPTVSVSQSATEHVVAQAQDGASISVPPAAAAGSGTVQVEVKPTVEAPSQAAAKVVSTVYEVTIRDAGGTEITQLKDNAEIILPYSDEDLKKQGVTEDTIAPSFFDEKTGSWVTIDNYTVDKDKNIIIARVKHLTRFAIVAAADVTPPLAPANASASAQGNGKISIIWVNPTRDFSHAKVYKSERLGMLGEILAAEVRGTSAADNAVRDGVTYYYTVRSVDPAGNESGNTQQVLARAVGTSAVFLSQAKTGTLPPGQAVKAALLKNLRQGSSGDDVKTLQSLLLKEGAYPHGLITGYFGSLTKQAVIRFQEKYMPEILTPVGLAKGNGFVGPATRKKINALLGK